MKKRILTLLTFSALLVMCGMAYAAGGEYSIDGIVKGTYQHIDLDSNGAINIVTNSSTPGNTNKIVVQVNTDYIAGKAVGISGVKIDLTGGAAGSGTTSTSGAFTFSNLPDGTYEVIVTPTHANYASFTSTPASGKVNFTGANQIQTITFDGTPLNTYSIVGNVKALTGTDVTQVVMELKYGSTVLINDDRPVSGGNYEIADLPDGVKYTVTPILSPKNFDPTFQNVTLAGQNSTANFTELSTTTGQFTAAIKGAYHLDTILISNSTGGNSGFGYGFKDQCTPGPASVREGGMTYFLADPIWISAAYTTLKFKWYDFSLTKGFKINLYAIDSLDNGTLLNSSNQNQAYFSITKKAGYRYLLEVDTTNCSNGFSLGVTWPK